MEASVEEGLAGTQADFPACGSLIQAPFKSSMEPIPDIKKFRCPLCDQKLSVQSEPQDIIVNCPTCSGEFIISGSSERTEPVEAPANSPFVRKKFSNKKRKYKNHRNDKADSVSSKRTKHSRNMSRLVVTSVVAAVLIITYLMIPKEANPSGIETVKVNDSQESKSSSKEAISAKIETAEMKPLQKAEVSKSSIPVVHHNREMAKHIQPFMKEYCISCHNKDKKKGDMQIDDIDYSLTEHSSVYKWQDILDVLNAGEMPPEKKKQPSTVEMKNAIKHITNKLQAAKQKLAATGGDIKMRHLNKREYYASIKDLFDIELPESFLYNDYAPDFDTNGADQFFTSASLDNYLEIGEAIAKMSLLDYSRGRRTPRTTTHAVEKKNYEYMQKQLAEQLEFKKKIDSGATYKDLGLTNEKRLIRDKKRMQEQIAEAKEYLSKPEHKFGSTDSIFVYVGAEKGQHYKFIVNAGSLKARKAPIKIKLEANSTDYGILSLTPTEDKKQQIELAFRASGLDRNIKITGTLLSSENAYISNIEIKGPYPSTPSFAENVFKPLLSQKSPKDEDAAKAIKSFAQKAFRYQEGNEDFIEAVIQRYKKNRNLAKESVIDSFAKSISLILTSPSFLYIAEKNNGGRQALRQKEFAIRLAYFLWETPPDETLYKLAESKQLYNPDILKAQFERMLKSEKADKFLASFINQWAGVRRFDEVDLPNELLKGTFQKSARAELSEFFKVLVYENLPADKLIDSDFIVINQDLAVHYGMKTKAEELGQGFKKVSVTPSSRRGGLLSQAAFLIIGSSGERTSPTIRGTIVRTLLLNDPPPEPPANVPEIETAKEGVVSVKELVEHHKSLPQCASCHNKIDPIGLGLENFDQFGQWREEESLRVGPKKRNKTIFKNLPLDTRGYLSHDETFSDFQGLQTALLKNRNKLAESLYSALLSYGIGRTIEFVDEADIQQNLKLLERSNYRLKDMLFTLINSKTFRTK